MIDTGKSDSNIVNSDSNSTGTPKKAIPTRIMSIDYGMARIGIAISDERKILASPLPLVLADKKTEKTVMKIVNEIKIHEEKMHCQIEEIIIGLPLMMSGKMSFLADEVRHFSDLLKQHISIPIILWDERLTSVQAERAMIEGELTRKRRAKSVDSLSAIIILQSYLEMKSIKANQ